LREIGRRNGIERTPAIGELISSKFSLGMQLFGAIDAGAKTIPFAGSRSGTTVRFAGRP